MSEATTIPSPTIDRDEIVRIASRLISVPSPSGEEAAVMASVTAWCDELGLNYQVVAKDPARPNVVISVGDPATGPTLAMNGHLDTVPVSDPDAWTNGPFEPTLSDDGKRLFGRGASDMKSSVGVMLYVMSLFRDAPLKGCLQAHVVSDEETSARWGSIFLLEEIAAGRLPKPDYCLIGEKSDLKVRNAERGILGLEIRFIGRASHTAAARATGINAIAKAAKGVLALEKDLDKFHPAIGKPVISVNTITAGVAHNVVPGECTITVDRRLIPGEDKDSAGAEIVASLDAVAAEDPEFRYELTVDPHDDWIAANITEESSPLVQAIKAAATTVTGQEPPYFVSWAGATDGRFYRQAGIDTVGFGPGGERAHGADECVYVDDLVTQAGVYVETVRRLLG
ncbi:MAG TPA: ArgE/DapE family deacylase [Thermomicrobiales bacterium]|nr:ArgE/DapE family deacylase [Thermomicrobiales bacterium]